MSENVHQILRHGIAAAQSTHTAHHAESYRYLKEVLHHPEATPEQKTTAWLWLSQLENDTANKQFCLDQALQIDPHNVVALHGLEILKNRVAGNAASQHHLSSGAWRSSCPQCGGIMEFEIEHRQLTCQSCGYHHDPLPMLHHLAGEQDFLVTLPTRQAQAWHLGNAQTLNCSGCGATFTLPNLQISGECPFCGSLHVLETTADTDLIEPDGIVIFQIDETAARHAVDAWLTRHYPPDHDVRYSRLRAIYVPYWTFDLTGMIAIGANYHDDWVDPHSAGTRIQFPYLVDYDDLLVPATSTLPPELLDEIGNFATTALSPYSSEILAAWSAEVYQVSLAAASLAARGRAVAEVQKQGRPISPSDAGEVEHNTALSNLLIPISPIVDSTLLRVQSYKLVLLPIWLGRYRWHDHTYRLIINGQTGQVAGEKLSNGWRHWLGQVLGTE
jgi:hypothetical protein